MVISQMTQRKKKPSSITVTTSAQRLTSQMIKPTLLSMMLNMINKVIPKIETPSMKEISKTLYNGLLKNGKLSFRSDFDLGKEILKQVASLKMQGLEMVTDKVLEHEEKSHDNNSHKEDSSNSK